jgi:UPF0755 protein
MKKYWWVFVIAAPMFAFAMAIVWFYFAVHMWTYQGEDQVFVVKPNESFSRINARLYKKGLIKSARIFHRWAQFQNSMEKTKAGQYVIKSGSSVNDILQVLIKGQSLTLKVTIPEGKNLFEIAKILQDHKIIGDANEFIATAKDQIFTRSLKIPAERVEGYLYPETYYFTPNSSAETVIKKMVQVFNHQTKELDFTSAPIDFSKHQLVILASLVEKETGAGHERPLIAGVFYNRLRKRQRLQSDPTTIYGIWEYYEGNLKKKHLLEKTPYNTYKITGLPKGPIANPGRASLEAVLNPAKHNFYYFVSKNNGTHIFSETYKQHVQAVNNYQKNYKARQGKSWRDYKEPKKN